KYTAESARSWKKRAGTSRRASGSRNLSRAPYRPKSPSERPCAAATSVTLAGVKWTLRSGRRFSVPGSGTRERRGKASQRDAAAIRRSPAKAAIRKPEDRRRARALPRRRLPGRPAVADEAAHDARSESQIHHGEIIELPRGPREARAGARRGEARHRSS